MGRIKFKTAIAVCLLFLALLCGCKEEQTPSGEDIGSESNLTSSQNTQLSESTDEPSSLEQTEPIITDTETVSKTVSSGETSVEAVSSEALSSFATESKTYDEESSQLKYSVSSVTSQDTDWIGPF